MGFSWQIEHWSTVQDFAAHLARHDPAVAPWAQGLAIHHTYRPLPLQWQGRRSMEALGDFYEGKGWSAGPHLFLCSGAPDARNDGIWQGTPLDTPGIHAGTCNAHLWGCEVVGDYDRAPWPAPVADLVYGASGALFRWKSLTVTAQSLRGHRECLPNKTCPGAAIDMDLVRAQLAQQLEAPIVPQPITEDSAIVAPFRCTQRQAVAYLLSRPHPNYTSADITLTIVPAYAELCAKAGVDLCITIAQMVHETGNLASFWSAPPQFNPSGIGVNGRSRDTAPVPPDGWAYNPQRSRWEQGISFHSWDNAVPSHVGRLVAYALPSGTGTADQQALIAEALRWRALPKACRGSAPTLRLLGSGPNAVPGCGWAGSGDAGGADYGAKIAAVANAIAGMPL
jgi:hypothetical protein